VEVDDETSLLALLEGDTDSDVIVVLLRTTDDEVLLSTGDSLLDEIDVEIREELGVREGALLAADDEVEMIDTLGALVG